MLDISEGGFRLCGGAEIRVGASVLVRYVEPVTHSVRLARAEARWVRVAADGRGEIGFSFEPESHEAREAIRSFVAFSHVSLRRPR
jgi:hypothetical protein